MLYTNNSDEYFFVLGIKIKDHVSGFLSVSGSYVGSKRVPHSSLSGLQNFSIAKVLVFCPLKTSSGSRA